MSALYYAMLPTSVGWVGVVASEKGVRRLSLPQASPYQALEKLQPEVVNGEFVPSYFEELRQLLEAYFSGEPVEFRQELDVGDATPFFLNAWAACQTIPRGETRSYAWLAAKAGNSRAVRAAGQAMARNPVPIIVPCHRVIASDGGMCGYGGGLGLKQRLLDLERRVLI